MNVKFPAEYVLEAGAHTNDAYPCALALLPMAIAKSASLLFCFPTAIEHLHTTVLEVPTFSEEYVDVLAGPERVGLSMRTRDESS